MQIPSLRLAGSAGRRAPGPCGARLRAICGARLVRFASPPGAHTLPQPRSEVSLTELAFRERQHREVFLLVRRDKIRAVEREKGPVGDVRGALVAVQEWMVTREPVRERRGKIAEIRRGIAVGMQLLWTRQRRLQQSLVAHTTRATVLGQLALMHSKRQRLFDPDHHRQ